MRHPIACTYDSGMRVVLDTSVLGAGLRSHRGASSRVLYAVAKRRCIPVVTTAIFLAYEAVLLRSEQRLAPGMSPETEEGFIAAFASAAEPVDELMLEAAVNGPAEALATHNVGESQSATARFGVRTLTPGALLTEIATCARFDGDSLTQFIAPMVAEKVGTLRAASGFPRHRHGSAQPEDLLRFLRRAPRASPFGRDEWP